MRCKSEGYSTTPNHAWFSTLNAARHQAHRPFEDLQKPRYFTWRHAALVRDLEIGATHRSSQHRRGNEATRRGSGHPPRREASPNQPLAVGQATHNARMPSQRRPRCCRGPTKGARSCRTLATISPRSATRLPPADETVRRAAYLIAIAKPLARLCRNCGEWIAYPTIRKKERETKLQRTETGERMVARLNHTRRSGSADLTRVSNRVSILNIYNIKVFFIMILTISILYCKYLTWYFTQVHIELFVKVLTRTWARMHIERPHNTYNDTY
jgi:hypothetical protein